MTDKELVEKWENSELLKGLEADKQISPAILLESRAQYVYDTYEVIKDGVLFNVLTPQDQIGIFASIGSRFYVKDDSFYIFKKNGESQETIDYVEPSLSIWLKDGQVKKVDYV